MEIKLLEPHELPREPVSPAFHPTKLQVQGLADSICTYGWIVPVVVAKNLWRVIDGVTRIDLANSQRLGPKHKVRVPTIEIEATEAEAIMLRMALNLSGRKLGAMKSMRRGILEFAGAGEAKLDEAIVIAGKILGFRPAECEILFAPLKEQYWPTHEKTDSSDSAGS